MTTQLLTVREVANKLGVHVNTVRTMAEDGRLQGIKTKGDHGHWRFKLSDVESFMNTNQHYDLDSILGKILFIADDIPSPLIAGAKHTNETIWEFVNKYYGIRNVFGSYALHSEMETYRNIIDKKGFIWLGEGATNFMDAVEENKNNSKFFEDKFINQDHTKYAFGVVKYTSFFREPAYTCVPLLVVIDRNEKQWIVDGTLQQFYPNLQKGLCVLPLEDAKNLYIGLEVFSKKEFAKVYSDPTISDRFINKAREMEKVEND